MFPQCTTTPKMTPVEEIARKAQNVLAIIKKQANVAPTNPAANRHLTALKQLTGIFQCLNAQQNVDNPSKSPRVGQTKRPSSTPGILPRVSDATSPRVDDKKWSSKPTSRTNRFLPQPATHKHPTRNRKTAIQTKSLFARAAIKHWFELQDVCEKHAHMVINPITGEPQNYKNLHKNPKTRKLWGGAMSKELGRLSQGIDGITKGTDCLFFVTHEEILNMPKDRTVTCARTVVDCRPQKKDPHRVRTTAGGNLINCPGELTARTADMVTSKILWNSVVSTKNARCCTADTSNFYLATPLDRCEHMRMPAHLIPDEFMHLYNLWEKIKDGFTHAETRKGIYGSPQSGILANKLSRKRLEPFGYCEVKNTPGLCKHKTRPVTFTLAVDDFGIKCEKMSDAVHLINALKKYYDSETDWTGKLCCGTHLKWNCVGEPWLEISMPGCVEQKLTQFQHEKPTRPQHARVHPRHLRLVKLPKSHRQKTPHHCSMLTAQNEPNKSWDHFYFAAEASM